jgi:alkylation response protein AidB-like acyl-CoA dehydrogenase
MDLSLTETQEEFKKSRTDFVKAEVPAHQMTQWYKNKQTFQPQLVKKAGEIGWLGMMLPESTAVRAYRRWIAPWCSKRSATVPCPARSSHRAY